jgi:TATA element modulatory factor
MADALPIEPTREVPVAVATQIRPNPWSQPSATTEDPIGKAGEVCGRCGDLERAFSRLQANLDEAKASCQEDVHGYVEQVDALQAKLQFLSREVTEAARKSAQSSSAGSVERKLAEKDEKIALLMDEGQSLAAVEQKHRAIIKKLRGKAAEDEKTIADLMAARHKARAEMETLRSNASRTAELEKVRTELRKASDQLKSELESLRAEVATKDATIASLKSELQRESARAVSIAAKANGEAAEMEKRRRKELEDSVAALQVEKSLIAERAKIQAAELSEKAERSAERSRATELEMKGELQVMEAKLEAMRALVEETSSGATGDSQAKVLRQVETLQTQYAIASENWQGIEASLVARIASIEKEKDEALRRESDMRKKAREAVNSPSPHGAHAANHIQAIRFKRQEEELQQLMSKLSSVQRERETVQESLDSMRKKGEEAELALSQARSDLEKQQSLWKAERLDSVDKERRNWLDDIPTMSARAYSRPDSPLHSMPPRTFSSDMLVLHGPHGKVWKASTPPSLTDGLGDGQAQARPLSSQPPIRPPIFPVGSLPPATTMSSAFEGHLESLPGHSPLASELVGDKDDAFEGLDRVSSPQQAMQDVMSVSTVAAGPSVQLVERMSAAIRRLEGEKVAAREELARVSGQRDEARAEMVALMKEVEVGRLASGRIAELENEVIDINSRYQTTLEMLGEKSELVEELRADVEDVKAMYRDLIERTVK